MTSSRAIETVRQEGVIIRILAGIATRIGSFLSPSFPRHFNPPGDRLQNWAISTWFQVQGSQLKEKLIQGFEP